MSANTYETVFIAEPEISNDQVDQLVAKLKQAIAANQGTVIGEDRWGRRRLAYPIRAHREGYYAIMSFTAEPAIVNAIEHLYNVTDSVIRHLTTRIIKKNKTFPPRRERTGAHADGPRHSGRPGSGPRRSESPASAPAAKTPEAAAEPSALSEGAASPAPEGGTPS